MLNESHRLLKLIPLLGVLLLAVAAVYFLLPPERTPESAPVAEAPEQSLGDMIRKGETSHAYALSSGTILS